MGQNSKSWAYNLTNQTYFLGLALVLCVHVAPKGDTGEECSLHPGWLDAAAGN
jgi:hypothetical protein